MRTPIGVPATHQPQYIAAQTRDVRERRATARSIAKRTPQQKAAEVTEQRLRQRDEIAKARH